MVAGMSLDPINIYFAGFISQRGAMAEVIADSVGPLGFYLLVLHYVSSGAWGLVRGEGAVEIFVGRWLLPYPIYLTFTQNYWWELGLLPYYVGELGPKLSGLTSLDPGEIIIQGANFGVLLWEQADYLNFVQRAFIIFPLALLVFLGNVVIAARVTQVLIETLFFFQAGRIALLLSVSTWTWGMAKTFFKLGMDIGLRLVFYHMILSMGNVGLARTAIWLEQIEFGTLYTSLTACGMALLMAYVSISLPVKYARLFSEGFVEQWGNPGRML